MKLIRDKSTLEAELRDFAIRVNREVCIRAGIFPADSVIEKRQRSEGLVTVPELDTVKGYLIKHGG